MCGFVVSSGKGHPWDIQGGLASIMHRGPDDIGWLKSNSGKCSMGHCRLSIIDVSRAGRQPMESPDGRFRFTFNGELYNYLELKSRLPAGRTLKSATDSEVLLAMWESKGEACLHDLIGMFAFVVWDERDRKLVAVRDRFGVKPLFYHSSKDGVLLASEIKAIHSAGVAREPDESSWADYLTRGIYDHGPDTFWKGVKRVPPGHLLEWDELNGVRIRQWYDPAMEALEKGLDARKDGDVEGELLSLLEESVRFRFRADVNVGICLSGGLDSSLLLGLIRDIYGERAGTKTFTFYCGDERYDETPWVERMLAGTDHPSFFCRLCAEEVPELARAVMSNQDEPYGGLPTLGMAKVHQRAREQDVTVLLDGNGMDEGWAGYEYYRRVGEVNNAMGPVQGSRSRSTRPDCLDPAFAGMGRDWSPTAPFSDPLRDLQLRDLCYTKIPRAMRFADRVSMMYSRELREPFLDHRIMELGLRQPVERKIRDKKGKWLPRLIAARLLPGEIYESPKRPVQTPQREWLKGPLAGWVNDCIETALNGPGSCWLNEILVRDAWREYREQGADNSFPIWQWISLGLMSDIQRT